MRLILAITLCLTASVVTAEEPNEKEKALLEARGTRRSLAQDPAVHKLFSDIVGVPAKTPWTWKVTHCASAFNDEATFNKLWLGDIARRVGQKNASTELAALKKQILDKYKVTPHVVFQAFLTYKETRDGLFLNEAEVKDLVIKLEAEEIRLTAAGLKKTNPQRKLVADGLAHLRAPAPMLKLGDPIVLADEAKADEKK